MDPPGDIRDRISRRRNGEDRQAGEAIEGGVRYQIQELRAGALEWRIWSVNDKAINYESFLQSKQLKVESSGREIDRDEIHPMLFDFQKDLTKWAIRKGRAAIFADTGLGKTFMQLEWARLIGGDCLIVAPLSVAKQTIREAEKIDIEVNYIRSNEDIKPGINITNYELVDRIDSCRFGSVVLDESSILKSIAGKTKAKLIALYQRAAYKLCCTATPSPNDIAEIANHAEFLNVMTRQEMLSNFFVHDNTTWRLKGHAEIPFYRWLASWGMSIKKPSDLGYEDDGFVLPGLNIIPHFIESDYCPAGQLFFTTLKGITNRLEIRRKTIKERTQWAADIINTSDEAWLIWCGLNEESKLARQLIPDGVEVKGADSLERKIENIESFKSGDTRVLITKTKIAGFGMNFQHCHNVLFLGLNDSWEAYYQAIRRCYRFGQKHQVNVHIILSEQERGIFDNIMKKERQALAMSANLIDNVQQFERGELRIMDEFHYKYQEKRDAGENWTLHQGDCIELMPHMDAESVDLSVFSPPFSSLYTYSPTERDVGNCQSDEQFFEHFGFVISEILRMTKPGRICAIHCMDIPAMMVHDGYIGLKDFSGQIVTVMNAAGWIYHGRVTIDKNPQVKAIRSHVKGLLFVQLRKDSSWSRPAEADYILLFRKPGENQVPIKPIDNKEIDNEKWIEWAHPVWYGIRETDVLNARVARDNKDERHMCPLQLPVIERCLKLWSNPGEMIFSPFAGIGSEGYEALRHRRKFLGIELKEQYYKTAITNLKAAEQMAYGYNLFEGENDSAQE